MTDHQLFTTEIRKNVRRIQIRTSRLADDMLAGMYHSAFKGRGIEFEEVRPYQIGDDVRAIDWNVTARAGEPFIKLFREEREMSMMLMVDLSASQSVGSQGILKRERVAQVGATLAFAAIDNSDKVGLLGFTDEIEKTVPARKGKRHVLRVIRELLYCDPISTGTDIAKALTHLTRVQKRHAVVFLISDFLDQGYARTLRVASRKHDIVPIVISDPCEFELPNVGLLEVRDAEHGRQMLVDTASRRNRHAYREKMLKLTRERDRTFKQYQIDAIHINTRDDFIEPIVEYFHKREMRQWH